MSTLEHLRSAIPLAVLEAAKEANGALTSPDYWGPRWMEVYRGSSINERFTCVDFCLNVLHVRRLGQDKLTLTYVPGWLHHLVRAVLGLDWGPGAEEVVTARVTDLASSVPVEYTLLRERELVRTDRAQWKPLPFTLPSFGYELDPARELTVQEERGEAGKETRHWCGMRLHLVCAPGVSFEQRQPMDKIDRIREYYEATVESLDTIAKSPASSDQTLRFEFERRQDWHSIPGLGARVNRVPAEEPELAALAEFAKPGSALVIETARSDGVDIVIISPPEQVRSLADDSEALGIDSHLDKVTKLAIREFALRMYPSVPAWAIDSLVRTLGLDTIGSREVLELLDGFLSAVGDAYTQLLGGWPRSAPILLRIRVDVESPDDRFAYRVIYLDADGAESNEPPPPDPLHEGPFVRVVVERTDEVRVFVDAPTGKSGRAMLESLVEYYEKAVDFDDVPLAIPDVTHAGNAAPLPIRKATPMEGASVIYTLGLPLSFIFPPIGVLYDLEDVGSLYTYWDSGTDVWGEKLARWEVGLIIAGFVLPEVAERALKRLGPKLRNLTMLGDEPMRRIKAAAEALVPADLSAIESVLARLRAS